VAVAVGISSILVVDPDVAVCDLLKLILSDGDCPITTVQTLDEACSELASKEFGLIITEAFDQADSFTFDPSFLDRYGSLARNAPILLCSIYPSSDSMKAGDFGLAEVVTKPFPIEELERKVERLMNNHEAPIDA
jgi:DNA-binding NtrC family response regulator